MINKNNINRSIVFLSNIKKNIYTKYKKQSNLRKLRLIFYNYRRVAIKYKLMNLIYLIDKKKVRIHKNLLVSLKSEPTDFSQLKSAILKATPGDTIVLQPYTNYYGNLFIKNDINGNSGIHGTPDNYINIIGDNTSYIIGTDISSSYVFYLGYSSYIFIGNNNSSNDDYGKGFNLTNALKGFYAENCDNIIIKNLNVFNIGNEGVHFMNNSKNCSILNNQIYNTGKSNPEFGEGIYIGSAYSNWNQCLNGEDLTHDIQIKYNHVYNTPGECLDAKEGTYNGIVEGNQFKGNELMNDNFSDSWIDIKGSIWSINNNNFNTTLTDGIQTHSIKTNTGEPIPNSGCNNSFDNNNMNCITIYNTPCSGYGIYINKDTSGNIVYLNNSCINAAKGLTNISTTPL